MVSRREDRRVAIERAVEQAIRITVPDKPETKNHAYSAYNTDHNTEYAILRGPSGGYHCLCPSARYRPYCKHLAALDVYFIEHNVDDSAHSQVLTVKLAGKTITLGEAERQEVLDGYQATKVGR